MKIGILTLCHKSNMNYRAVLQAWALKTVIERIVPGGGFSFSHLKNILEKRLIRNIRKRVV